MDWIRDDAGQDVTHTRPVMSDGQCGASEAAETWRPRLDIGMYVRGSAGEEIGQVKEINSGSFLVDRLDGEPVVLPFERIHAIISDRIRLDVPAADLDEAQVAHSSFTDIPYPGDAR